MLLNIFDEMSTLLVTFIWIAFIFAGIVAGLELFASITRFAVACVYMSGRRIPISSGHTAGESARIFLNSNGLSDVKIQEIGFWKSFFFGTHFNPRKNILYITRKQINQSNLSDCSDVIQKVAKAINYRFGDEKCKRTIRMQSIIPFSGYLILPIVLVGLIVDCITGLIENNPIFTLLTSGIALIFFVVMSIYAFKGMKVEKQACVTAKDLMIKSNYINNEQLVHVEKIYKWKALAYLADFLIAIVRIIQTIFEILKKIIKVTNKK